MECNWIGKISLIIIVLIFISGCDLEYMEASNSTDTSSNCETLAKSLIPNPLPVQPDLMSPDTKIQIKPNSVFTDGTPMFSFWWIRGSKEGQNINHYYPLGGNFRYLPEKEISEDGTILKQKDFGFVPLIDANGNIIEYNFKYCYLG